MKTEDVSLLPMTRIVVKREFFQGVGPATAKAACVTVSNTAVYWSGTTPVRLSRLSHAERFEIARPVAEMASAVRKKPVRTVRSIVEIVDSAEMASTVRKKPVRTVRRIVEFVDFVEMVFVRPTKPAAVVPRIVGHALPRWMTPVVC